MPESVIVKTKRDGTLTFKDGSGVPNTFTVAFEAGDLSITIPGPTVNNFLDRGRMTVNPSIRYGDDQPVTGTFTGYLRDFDDGGTGTATTLMEIITQSGVAAGWTSTMGANGEVFCLTLEWVINGVVHGDPANHTCELEYCYVTGAVAEGDPDQITINFTSYKLYPTLS